MTRREFITFLGGATATWPLAARAQQQPTMPVIGWVNPASRQDYAQPLAAFLMGLGETGYVDGRNVSIEYRWGEHHKDRLPALVADLIHRQVAVIAATTTAAALAAKAATRTIPIVFETGADPVELGLVASLNRPGGNVTGATQLTAELTPKLLEILHELLPGVRVMALLVNPTVPPLAEDQTRTVLAAAGSVGLQFHVLNASSEKDFAGVFEKLGELQAGALVIGAESLFTSHSEQMAALAFRNGVPAIYKGREFAAAGGLMSYGSDIADSYRNVGVYVGRILKGEKPIGLPVQQATKFELYINLKTAKALGITVPLPLSGRADELFE
jgi:putative tryptophan/tyrosine transport system substrate-binding protein